MAQVEADNYNIESESESASGADDKQNNETVGNECVETDHPMTMKRC